MNEANKETSRQGSMGDEGEFVRLGNLLLEFKRMANTQIDEMLDAYAQARAGIPAQPPVIALPFIYPLADYPLRITSRFGEQRPTFDHEGIDFSATVGRTVHCMYDGIVEDARIGKDYGLRIWIRHEFQGRTIKTCYAHLSRADVSSGQIVKQGQVIGASGGDKKDKLKSGNSTAPHLHITVLDSAVSTVPRGCGLALKGAVDPLLWIKLPQ